MEDTSLVGVPFGTNGSAMAFHNALANGKPDARSLVLCPCVKPLERLENAVSMPAVESDAIVGHRNRDASREVVRGTNFDEGRPGAVSEF